MARTSRTATAGWPPAQAIGQARQASVLADHVGTTCPHTPRESLRSVVGRMVFYWPGCVLPGTGGGRVLLPLSARPDAGVNAAVDGPWQRCVSAARCCGVFLPPQEAQCNPGGATSRLGASALPIARNGSPLDMAWSARIGNAREGGRKTTNAAATGRFAARGRTACFTPRRQGRNGRSGGSTGTRRCTAAAHSPQKKTSS